MFYLAAYLKTLWYGRSVGFFYGVLSLMVLTFAGNINNFKQRYIDQNKNPYFNALLSAPVNTSTIVKKMKDIPGVENVVLSSSLHLKKEVQSVLKLSSSQVLDDVIANKYMNLKVELSPHIEKKSQDLIMEYLRRMLGNSKVTMSQVIDNKQQASNDSIKQLVLDWGHYMILAFLGVIWVFATWVVGQKLQNRAYLINMFQRRKLVTFKVFSCGQGLWLLLSIGLCMYFNGSLILLLSVAAVLTLTGLSLLSIRKNEFIKV